MVLWILLISMVLFAINFIALIHHPRFRYPISIFFLLLAIVCSLMLMMNDAHHLGMKQITDTKTEKLVSTMGKKSPLKMTVYKKLGNGSEKIFVYRTASSPNKQQKTRIDYDVTTKVQHSNVKEPQVVIKRRHYAFKNHFWKVMYAGLGIEKEAGHITYIFKVPQQWLVLSTEQLKDIQKQEKTAKKQLKTQIKEQLPTLVKSEMTKQLAQNPNMSNQEKAQLQKKITQEQQQKLVDQLTQAMMQKLMPQLKKESL